LVLKWVVVRAGWSVEKRVDQ
jgi:hypothetical protein